jgi:spermidine/putrescine transport system ATP-binding protein
MSDRIAVMLDGHVEQLADPYTIYEHPATAFVAGFIGQQNFFEGTAADGGKTVHAGDLTARSSRPAEVLGDGAVALVAVRPETIAVSEERPAKDANVRAGTLAGVSHLGDVIQFVITAPDGKEMLSRVPRTKAPRLLPGASVWCSWEDEHTYVFSADQADIVLADPASLVESK